MNCIGPCAPAYDDEVLAPCPDSTWPIAASSVQDMPWQVFAAADVEPPVVRRARSLAWAVDDPRLRRRGGRRPR